MAFNTGLSGLRAASVDLDVTGNNIANASTVGFKGSKAQFGDLYASGFLSAGTTPIGDGVKVQDVKQSFGQGNISFTDNGLDLAIDGEAPVADEHVIVVSAHEHESRGEQFALSAFIFERPCGEIAGVDATECIDFDGPHRNCHETAAADARAPSRFDTFVGLAQIGIEHAFGVDDEILVHDGVLLRAS